MSTMKPAIPVTNLKERIAALEQKNAEAAQRSTSPAPGSVGAALAANGSAMRDRIAKFEKKGAVPAPRGRFGLGAPPPAEAQVRRSGELYGNRIPQPMRFASGSTSPSRSGSSIGFYNGSPDFDSIDKRRSFSVNSVFSDFDDGPDYTPLTSPTFAFPPDSPGSVVESEGPPSPSATSEGPSFKESIKRAAPFSEVLEAARKAAEKDGGADHINDPKTPTPFVRAANSFSEEGVAQTPVNLQEPITTPIEEATSSTPPRSPSASIASAVPETIVEKVSEETPATIITSVAAPTIVVQSPTISHASPLGPESVPVEEPTPDTPVAQPKALPEETVVSASPAVPVEVEKPKVKNSKDLTVSVEQVETALPASGPTSTESDGNITPTTANHPGLLSPAPASAVSSIFSGSSFESGSSSIRPFSMIDISLAERVTPATSRGNVVFLPPSTATMPRKSDLVYFPPTPTVEETKKVEEAAAAPTQAATAPEAPVTFTAVVHQKVRETSESIPHPTPLVPETPKNREIKMRDDKRRKRMTTTSTISTVLPSPGTNELASLIQNAVILENMVENGELPTERQTAEARDAERRQREKERLAALAAERARVAAEDAKARALLEAAQKKEKEKEFSTNKLRHTFLIPLSRARTQQQQQHRKESSTSDIETTSISGSLSHKSSRTSIQDRSPRLPKTPEIPETTIPEVPLPSKAPSIASSKSRFSTFRRLGSVKSAFGRPSMDISISEDTDGRRSGSVTPPINEFGQLSSENGTPYSSPKKSGRAATFAGKIFSRSRTKSSGSTLSTASGATSDSASSKAYSMYTLPPLPDALSVIRPSPEYEERSARRSTSLRSLRGLKNIPPPMNIPPVPHISHTSAPTVQSPSTAAGSPVSDMSSPGYLKSPDYLGFGTMDLSVDQGRPTSWMSVSSLTSELPSPLFEKDIFDAFPSVPASTPAMPSIYGAATTSAMTPAMTPSFDSAFLSTAIHLGGSRNAPSTTPKSSRSARLPH